MSARAKSPPAATALSGAKRRGRSVPRRRVTAPNPADKSESAGFPDDQRGGRAGVQLVVGALQLGAQLGDPGPQRVDVRLEFDDPFDAGQVDALVLREALHLAQQRDVTRRVAASPSAGAARSHQAEAVVL